MASKSTGASGLADRYAAALFELAEQRSALDQVAGDLKSLRAMIESSVDLRRLLSNPVMSRKVQLQAMSALAGKAGFNELTGRFVGVLASNRRLVALSAIIQAFLARLAAKKGEVTAQVVAARALSSQQQDALGAALKKAVGGNVALDLRVDPTLIGGLVVQVGSRMLDASLKTKLQQVQLAMKGVR